MLESRRAQATNNAGEGSVERTGLDSRFELDFLEGDELSGELVPGFVDDAVGALADLLDLLEVLHGEDTTSFDHSIRAPAVEIVNTERRSRSPSNPNRPRSAGRPSGPPPNGEGACCRSTTSANPPLQEKRGKSRAEFIEPLNRRAAAWSMLACRVPTQVSVILPPN